MPLQDDYQVRLSAFEGPLDLLLWLIRRAEVEIQDIPIHEITTQYLALLDQLDRVDMELAGEFLVMAATLVEIKSRTLAPPSQRGDGAAGDAPADAGEAEDPRQELIRQLLAYQRFRSAAEDLERLRQERESRQAASGAAGAGLPPPGEDDGTIDVEDAHILDLLESYEKIIAAIDFTRLGEHRVEYDDTPISLHQDDIVDQLRRAPGSAMTLQEIFRGRRRSEMIGLFLALLELARNQRLRVEQDAPGDPIRMTLAPDAG
ncbi:MAG: segregation/condensation protein A [Phycisphaerales bacterium]